MKQISISGIKPVLPTLGILVCVLILFYLVGSFLLGQLSNQNLRLEEAKKSENVLLQKKTVLSTIPQTVLDQASLAAIYLPTTNPALVQISQIKNLAFEMGLPVTEFSSSSPIVKEGGTSSVQTTFTLLGSISSVLDFISSLNTIAPLVTPERVIVSASSEGGGTSVIVNGHWAALPETITSVDEPLVGLTADEEELLNHFAILRAPNFGDGVAQPSVFREDPFN